MKQLESHHSKVYQEFVAENHSISGSDQTFSRVMSQLTQPWSNIRSRLEVKRGKGGGGVGQTDISKSKIGRKIVSNYSPKSLTILKKMCTY